MVEEFEGELEGLLVECERDGGGVIFDVPVVDAVVLVVVVADAELAGMSDDADVTGDDELAGKGFFKEMEVKADGLTSESVWRKKRPPWSSSNAQKFFPFPPTMIRTKENATMDDCLRQYLNSVRFEFLSSSLMRSNLRRRFSCDAE